MCWIHSHWILWSYDLHAHHFNWHWVYISNIKNFFVMQIIYILITNIWKSNLFPWVNDLSGFFFPNYTTCCWILIKTLPFPSSKLHWLIQHVDDIYTRWHIKIPSETLYMPQLNPDTAKNLFSLIIIQCIINV